MNDPLLVTKVSLPLMRHVFVPRKKVLRQLSEGVQDGHLFTLISAPAGYGKTTTIRMWVEEAGYPVAWVTLGKSDNDPGQFLTYLLTALGQAEEDLGQAALEEVENTQEVNLARVLGLLINDLYKLDHPIILVLEEYQLIENATIDRVLESILDQAVPNLHLVITTREDPNLPLTRLRVRNQLTEIRAMDLSFSLDEACEFFTSVMRINLSKEDMEILRNRTEGWVAGLQLAALSLKESGDRTMDVEAFRGTHRHVLDYLIDEVLKSRPEEIREFLRRTSILDQLSPSLCEAVTGQKAGGDNLHYLESNNLFLTSLNQERTWYRYHALFADLLKNQLVQIEPELVDVLHERAADWYDRNGFIEKAVEQAFQISNSDKVSKLIEQHAISMLYQGEVSVVMGWFVRLPASVEQFSPMMCISKAWSLALTHHRTGKEEVDRVLQAADRALKLSKADDAMQNLIAGQAASIQAYLVQSPSLTGEAPRKLIETSQKAQRLLPENEKGIRSVNYLNIGYGYSALADLTAAEQAYKLALEDGIAGGNFYAAVYGPIDVIENAMLKGELKEASELCETNIDRFNRLLAGQRFPPIGDLYSLKGTLLLEQNRPAEAEEALTQSLSLVHFTSELEARVRCHTTAARLRSLRGDRAGMLDNIQALEQFPESLLYAQALRHRLLLRDPGASQVSFEDADHWLTQAGVRFGTVPDIDRLDLVSRIHFQTCLSAAHILTRLAAQHPEAYSLADVHIYFARQEKFAEAHGLFGWLIEIWLLRALMYHVKGKAEDASRLIQATLNAALPRGYFRIFPDEGDVLRPLLESVEPRLKDSYLSGFVKRLLEAMPGGSAKSKTRPVDEEILSDRELEVLRLLAGGQTYKEIGQELFLSLNTVQFHVKNIYSKLGVNKRGQAIEKARERKLV